MQLGNIHSVGPEGDSNGTIHPDCSWHHAERLISEQQEGSIGSTLRRIALQLSRDFSILDRFAELIDHQNQRKLQAALATQQVEKRRNFIRATSIGNKSIHWN